MHLRRDRVGEILTVALALAIGSHAGRAEAKVKTAAADLSGQWKLNKQLSDDEQARLNAMGGEPAGREASDLTSEEDAGREGGSGRGRGRHGGGAGGGARIANPSVASGGDDDPRGPRRVSGPPEALTVAETGQEIAVEETPGQVRHLYPNGKTYKTDDGASEIKTSWRDGSLVVEKKNAHGWKLTEIWQLAPDRNRLRIALRFAGGSRPPLSLERVYDRAEPDR